jgi:hypothetical protein
VRIRAAGFSWRQPVAALGLLGAAVAVVGGTGWWVLGGPRGPLERTPVHAIPSYMSELSDTDHAKGVLVLKGNRITGIEYQVLRNGEQRLGDDAITALTPPDDSLTLLVGRLLDAPQGEDARQLASYGVAYVYAPSPVSASVSGSLDAATGFGRTSAPYPDAAWGLQGVPASTSSMNHDQQPARGLLLVLQLVAIFAGVVLALPSRRRAA